MVANSGSSLESICMCSLGERGAGEASVGWYCAERMRVGRWRFRREGWCTVNRSRRDGRWDRRPRSHPCSGKWLREGDNQVTKAVLVGAFGLVVTNQRTKALLG